MLTDDTKISAAPTKEDSVEELAIQDLRRAINHLEWAVRLLQTNRENDAGEEISAALKLISRGRDTEVIP